MSTNDIAPDSRRSMCGNNCGSTPCARAAGHEPPCCPGGEPCALGHFHCEGAHENAEPNEEHT
jgi:hypothetical protein